MHGPFRVSHRNPLAQVAVSLLLVWIIAGCGRGGEYVEPPPPKVTVAQPLEQEVTDYLEFTGTTRAFKEAEVRARVSGYLESMHFTPGTMVEKGDLLFVIDPREYEAQVHAAEAELESAKAQLQRARIELDRAQRLFEQKAGAEVEVVKWRGERGVVAAAVARAKAKLERARLDLSYTEVTAPISGRVGRSLVSVGNLVGADENTLLTTLVQYDPIWAYFSLNERQLLLLMRRALKKQTNPEANQEEQSVIHLGLADEDGYPHPGQVDYVDQGLDPDTGTFVLRGSFANPKPHTILPGMFVRIRIPIDQRQAALLVSEQALGADQRGRYVLVVNEQNSVEYRSVQVGAAIDGLRVIEKGLQPDDWVVVKGLLRARPGAAVTPEREEMMTRLPGSETTSQ